MILISIAVFREFFDSCGFRHDKTEAVGKGITRSCRIPVAC